MQINVAQLLKEPVGAMRSYKIDESTGENNEDYVNGEVHLTRTNRGILVIAELAAKIKGSCSRCLGPASISTILHLEEEYYPLIDATSGAHMKLEPEVFTIDNNHILDLDEAIRQYIIMATPTKFLCKIDCPGICPVCGQEFAGNGREYRNKPRDHRWDKLVELKKESKV